MKRFLLIAFAILAVINLSAQTSGGPDLYGYTWKNSNHTADPPIYQWFDITQIGMEVGGLGDDNVAGPFTAVQGFQFYWYPVDKFWIGSNGFITFNGDNIASPFPASVPLTSGANNWIAPLLADLTFGGVGNPGRCYYWSNPDTLCVSWLDVPFWTNNAVQWSGSNSFQVILNKIDKSITFNYLSTNSGQGTIDIVVGMENSTGTLGLGPMIDVLPSGLSTIKFYYPSNVTYAVTDGGVQWAGNEKNGGIFIPQGAPHNMEAMVKNFGNQQLNSFTVYDSVVHTLSNLVMTTGNVSIPSLVPQTTSLVNFPNTFQPATYGTYSFHANVTGITGDMGPANNRMTQEIIVIDTTMSPMTLDYSNGAAGGGSISWQGGNGGLGVYIEPPVYPVKIESTRFLIVSNSSSQGFSAQIFRDDGINKGPGSMIDSVFVNPMQVATGVYNTIPVANNNIVIDSGGVYLLWYMGGPDIGLGRDNTLPISYRTYEVIDGIWAEYRDKFSEDFCMGINITRPAPAADFTFDASADPTFTFSDASNYSPTSWSWDFGDGNTSNQQNPTHTYTTTGQKNVCLTATNTYGNNQKCKLITVSNGAPVAMFTYDDSNSPSVEFTDASGGAPTAWRWNFDDVGKDSSDLQNPTYIFNTNGAHNVCLVVSNQYGTSAPYCQTVTITGIGIEEIKGNEVAKVVPNPVEDNMIIVINGKSISENALLIVYDLAGKEIEVAYNVGNNTIEARSINLAQGLYTFAIKENGVLVAKGKFAVK